MFQRSSKDDSRKFQSCFDEVSKVFLESFKGVANSFWCGSLRDELKVFQGFFNKNFRGCFRCVFKGV